MSQSRVHSQPQSRILSSSGSASSLRLWVALGAALGVAGCDLSRARHSDPRLEHLNTSQVTGVVTLPDGADPEVVCDRLTVRALLPEQGGRLVGETRVHMSRGRCGYSVTQLPAGVELRLEVDPNGALLCPTSQPTVLPESAPLVLQDRETQTRDYRATCKGGQPS